MSSSEVFLKLNHSCEGDLLTNMAVKDFPLLVVWTSQATRGFQFRLKEFRSRNHISLSELNTPDF